MNELSNVNKTNIQSALTNKKDNDKPKQEKKQQSKEKEESDKVLNCLVDKLIKKFDFEKVEEFKHEKEFMNTKIYKNLVKRYSNLNQFDNDNTDIKLSTNDRLFKVVYFY
jgi:hypothetical protein